MKITISGHASVSVTGSWEESVSFKNELSLFAWLLKYFENHWIIAHSLLYMHWILTVIKLQTLPTVVLGFFCLFVSFFFVFGFFLVFWFLVFLFVCLFFPVVTKQQVKQAPNHPQRWLLQILLRKCSCLGNISVQHLWQCSSNVLRAWRWIWCGFQTK